MIEFIKNNIEDICYWCMFLFFIVSNKLLYDEKKANRERVEILRELANNLLSTEKELNNVLIVVNDFTNEYNRWHDRKIMFYYDQNGWHCCYADEMPQGDVVTKQEEITQQTENNNENK